MAISREKKNKIIKELEEKIKKQKIMVFFDFSNLDSKSVFDLRKRLKKSNCLLKIVKKTLLEKTLEKLGQKNFSDEIKKIKTPLGIAFGFENEIIPSKICYLFSKENSNLKILAGIFNNYFWESEKIIELAQLPSREEILIKLKQSLENPLLRFLNSFRANLKGLVMVLKAISFKSS